MAPFSGLVVNGVRMGWGDLRLYAGTPGIDLPFLGSMLSNVRAISWREDSAQTPVYGKGSLPVAHTIGSFTCTGQMTMYLEGYYWLSQLVTAVQGSLTIANKIRNNRLVPGRDVPNSIPVGFGLHYLPSFPLIVSYARSAPGDDVGAGELGGVSVARAGMAMVGLSSSTVFQTILPAVRFESVDRGARSGDHGTEVTLHFRVYGQPVSPTVPLL